MGVEYCENFREVSLTAIFLMVRMVSMLESQSSLLSPVSRNWSMLFSMMVSASEEKISVSSSLSGGDWVEGRLLRGGWRAGGGGGRPSWGGGTPGPS